MPPNVAQMPDPKHWPTVVDKVSKNAIHLPGVRYHQPKATASQHRSSKETKKLERRQSHVVAQRSEKRESHFVVQGEEESSDDTSQKDTTDDQAVADIPTYVPQQPPRYSKSHKIEVSTSTKAKKRVTLSDLKRSIDTVPTVSKPSQVTSTQQPTTQSAAPAMPTQQPLAQLPLLPSGGAVPKTTTTRRRKTKPSEIQQYLMIDTCAQSSTSESDTTRGTQQRASSTQPQVPSVASTSADQHVSWTDERRYRESFVDQTAGYDPLHVSFGQAQTHLYTQGGRLRYYLDPASTDESL